MNWAPTNQRSRIITRENNLNLINEKMDLNLNNSLSLENPDAFTDILTTGQGERLSMAHSHELGPSCFNLKNSNFYSKLLLVRIFRNNL